jgi:formylglycine-generating enzyme required for sulfatase activity
MKDASFAPGERSGRAYRGWQAWRGHARSDIVVAMVAFWRRSKMALWVLVIVIAAGPGRDALSDDCKYGRQCPDGKKDKHQCCPAPREERPPPVKGTPIKAPEDLPGMGPCPLGMVYVPGGTFFMGSPDRAGDPLHPVTLAGYCIDKTEVTVGAYARYIANKKSMPMHQPTTSGLDSLCNGTRADRRSHPVNCVDWNEANTYCEFAQKRLPTEAEWEFAARGGDGRQYPWGNQVPSDKRLNACGSECGALGTRLGAAWKPMYPGSDGWEATAPVGSYPGADESLFAALDMAGNVSEWTADWYGPYQPGQITNPSGAKAGTARVYRGGSWYVGDAREATSTYRKSATPTDRASYRGFRCARRATASTSPPPSPWPPGAVSGGSYTVMPSEATMHVTVMYLPDDYTVHIGPGVSAIRWTVDHLHFGVGAVIGLSPPVAASPPAKPQTPRQACWGDQGSAGAPGGPGTKGASGMTTVITAKTAGHRGSLWIRTDGGPGAPGGEGGDAASGGGTRCCFPIQEVCDSRTFSGRMHGGNGGNGGDGGDGGEGGDTADVTIHANGQLLLHSAPASCSTTCGASTKPLGDPSDDGKITIWGSPGCGGPPGHGGKGGGSGGPRRECPAFCGVADEGSPGSSGRDGLRPGPAGKCIGDPTP